MHSIKPGRGPSLAGAVGAIGAAGFGVFWIIMASSIGAPLPFVGFGIVFVVVALIIGGVHLYNTTAKNRMSMLDVTHESEESDPIATALGHDRRDAAHDEEGSSDEARQFPGAFCPYCGAAAAEHFDYCPACGRDI